MDFFTGIVSGIVVKIAETTVVPLYRQLRYVIHYKSNLQNLRSQAEKLSNAKDRMQHTINDEAIRKGKKVEADVENWLKNVDEITQEVDAFLEDECRAETKCFHGFCPNPIIQYRLSRKSTKLVQKLQLHEEKQFPSVSYSVPPQDICSIPSGDYLAFESRLSIVKDILEALRNSNTNRIGVYGIGGVGKTTLAKEVYRQAKEEKLFDDVVIIPDVKLIPNLEGIQKKILEMLNMDVVDGQTTAKRAWHLRERIKDKNILVILDDISERIDLEALGLVRVATCNILLTARTREVLFSEMRTQKDFQVEVLGEAEAWSLFKMVAGDVIKEEPIQKVATQVANKCGGLPILIVHVASALRISSLHEWKDALRRLKKFDLKGSEEKALLTLEWSYNKLDAEELKSLFLLCGIIAWSDNRVDLSDCFKYSMGLGLLTNVDTMEEAQNAFHSLIKKLQNHCLLYSGSANDHIRMHELVRNVAIRIARRDRHVIIRAHHEEEFKEWPNKDFFEKCTMISFTDSNIPTLPEVPWPCKKLKMLYFNCVDGPVGIPFPSNFFEDMKELKVLDLSGLPIPSLPPSVQFLTNLKTLCLDRCMVGDIGPIGQLRNLEVLSFLKSKIKELPKEIGQLSHLRLLDLTHCSKLVLISPNLIASLKCLEDLRIGRNSFKQWEAVGGQGKRTNASLLELKELSKLTALDIHIPHAGILPSDLFSDNLERFNIFIGEAWEWIDFDYSFNTLKLKLATSNQLDRGLEMLVKRSKHLYLDVMQGIDNIFHLLKTDGYQQLKHLQVQNNAEITCVINHNAFQKLQSLTLWNLPKVVSFSSKSERAIVTGRTDEQLKTDGESKQIILENEMRNPMKLFKNEEIVMSNLTILIVHQCDGLRFLLSSSMAGSLVQLKQLEVHNCQIMEEIVSTKESGEEKTDNFFCKLNHLQLQHLPQLTRFCVGNYIEFRSLELLHVEDCTKLETFICDPTMINNNITICKENEETDLKDNLETPGPYFLFDEKVGFPSLERLVIYDLPKLITIWHNQLSQDSFCRLKKVDVQRCHNLINIFAASIMRRLNALDTLQIRNCKSIQVAFELGGINVERHDEPSTTQMRISYLEILEVSLCGKLKNLSSTAISFQNLKTLKVIGCQGLEYLITSSIAQSLMQLTRLEVKNCERLVQIVGSSSEDEAGNDIAFNRLEHLELSRLPSLQCFFSGTMLSHQFTICDEIEESDAKENLDSAVQYFLFDKKVGLPRLETLIVHDLHKLMRIWHEQLAPDSFCRLKTVDVRRCQSLINIFGASILGRLNALNALKLTQCQSLRLVFEHGGINAEEEDDTSITPSKLPEYCQNLASVEIDSCESLRNIFPASVAKGLQQLRNLTVDNCDRVEEIVAMEELGMNTPKFVFPNATSVNFRNLPRLASFYPGMHASVWPLLEDLRVISCDNVEIFALEFSRFQAEPELGLVGTAIKQPLFLIEKGSFSNLEILHFYSKVDTMENWWSLLPAEFFSKLKSLRSQSGVFQSGLLQNLPHLQQLGLHGFGKEVFVHEGISSGEIQAVGTLLPHLKNLYVFDMSELMHLGKENSQPVLPNLESLRLELCGKLKNLRSSAISFQNLKALKVEKCHGLEYLTTYSIAQILTQLTHMEVKDCQGLTEIVAYNSNQDDDAVNEIAFTRLQRLELSGLPSLRRFCSGNCLVKIPSLGTLTVTECLIDMKISPDKVLLSNSKPERLKLKLIEEEANDHDKPEGSGTTRTQAT